MSLFYYLRLAVQILGQPVCMLAGPRWLGSLSLSLSLSRHRHRHRHRHRRRILICLLANSLEITAGKHFQMDPFGCRVPAFTGGPRGGRGFRAGPGRVVSPARVYHADANTLSLPSPVDVKFKPNHCRGRAIW